MKIENEILATKNLTIGYKTDKQETIVYSDINVSASKGELLALIGINGAGKSTLLRTLARLQKSLHGGIFIKDQNINDFKLRDFASTVSFVSTEPVSVSNLKVRELVALGRFPHTNWLGKLEAYDLNIIDDAIKSTGLENLADKNINEISEGEKQRAMIARTLAQDTELIIMDEPTAFLDVANRYETAIILKKQAKEKQKTIIFSTHDLNIAIQQADKIWLMINNRIIEGAPEDIILNNHFSNIFNSENISFDTSKGEFIFTKKLSRTIHLTGSGIEYEWTKKALARAGFLVTENKSEAIQVIITQNNGLTNWLIEKENHKFVLDSIYELIKNIEFEKFE